MIGDATAATQGPRTLVVILNFNGIDDTLECLGSLRSQSSQDFAVQVIDNGSRNDDLDRIRQRFPDTLVVASPCNLGWAGGNNLGMRHALDHGFEFVCLLNNDTVLEPTALDRLTAATAAMAEPCLMHPAIAFFDEPDRWQLDPAVHRDGSAGRLPLDIVELPFAYGACLMLPVEAVRKIGFLDERFFLQLEETDYFHRARALGIKSLCTGSARILHKESVSFGGKITENKTYYQVRNSLLLAEKHTRSLTGCVKAARALLWSLHHQAHVSAGVSGWPRFSLWLLSSDRLAGAARQGLVDYVRRRFGCRPPVRSA